MSNLINKIKDVIEPSQTTQTTTTTAPNHHGHHAGAQNPVGGAATGTGVSNSGYSASSNQGPHNSNLMNKLDPSVDSDMDGRAGRNTGLSGNSGAQYGGATGGAMGTHQPGMHSSGQYTDTGASNAGYSSTTTNTHDSNLLNKLDPSIDSNRTGGVAGLGGNTVHSGGLSGTTGTGYGGGGVAGTGGNHHTTHTGGGLTGNPGVGQQAPIGESQYGSGGGLTGQHGVGHHGVSHQGVGQQAPIGDSQYGGSGTGHSNAMGSSHTAGVGGGLGSQGTPGSGNALNTAGPHNSDLMNKLDPRVDSDLDGSGGSKTFT